MIDSRFRLTKKEEMHLDGNANSADVQIIHSGKRVQRKSCNTSVLVFVTILLTVACIALVVLLAIEKLHKKDTTRGSFCRTFLNTSKTSGNATLPCTSVQCVLASSSK